mgnify:CR=1 FL=1
MRIISYRYSPLIIVSHYQVTMILANPTFIVMSHCHTPNEVPTKDSAVVLVREAVLFARSIIELVMTEVGEGEKEVTEMELDLEEGEHWDRMEEGRDDVAATEFDLRL